MAKRRFVVEIERGERWWVASIPSVEGCHTQGRNLAQTRRNIRDCLALFVGDRIAESAELVEEIRFPSGVATALRRLDNKTHKLNELREQLDEERRTVIEELTAHGFSTHDVGALIGLSKPRVAQILNGG